jgi:hypothetical protein
MAYYRSLAEGFNRAFTRTLYFGSQREGERSQTWSLNRMHFFDEAEIWCARNPKSAEAGRESVNTLVLGEQF